MGGLKGAGFALGFHSSSDTVSLASAYPLPVLTDVFSGPFEASSSLIKRFALRGSEL